KPGAPVVFVDDTTRSSVSLMWNRPVRDGGSRVTGYIVEMRPQDGEEWTKAHATSAVRLTELTIDKLTEGQGYKFRVSAINEIGVGEPGEVDRVVFARDMLEAPEVELDVSLKRAMKVSAGAHPHLLPHQGQTLTHLHLGKGRQIVYADLARRFGIHNKHHGGAVVKQF
ncbi:PREDICTED: titin-like, partial [Branchiostoma belcheri]|uniref:Titin-like n=1 Tax=Branchiostoma belcheri TaxID=7741 RepID=A0A6P4ZE79_BRABE